MLLINFVKKLGSRSGPTIFGPDLDPNGHQHFLKKSKYIFCKWTKVVINMSPAEAIPVDCKPFVCRKLLNGYFYKQ